jgi:uncharacterized membrane protein
MDWIVLRLVHVLGGAFWFGAVFTNFVFVQPAVLGSGTDGQRVMGHVLRDRRFLDVVLGAALLTGIAGGVLFWRDTNGLDSALAFAASGLGFTIGGLAGLLALLLFIFVGYPNTRRLITIGSRLETERRAPTAAEQALLARSQAALRPIGVAVPVLLGVAAAAMATARYWGMVL